MSETDDSFAICVAGDAIYDEYEVGDLYTGRYPTRLIVDHQFYKPGGAANVTANLEAFTKGTNIKVIPLYDEDPSGWPAIKRFVSRPNTIQLEISNLDHDEDSSTDYYRIPSGRKGLVIADYHRGAVDSAPYADELKRLDRFGQFDFIIIDSRHGSYWPGWLGYGRMKILHVTGGEIDRNEPGLFNYTLHTNADRPINLLTQGVWFKTIPVPLMDMGSVVDPTGAGDTFVAAVAAHLAIHRNEAWDHEQIIEAVQKAIPYSQQIVKHLGVGVPNVN